MSLVLEVDWLGGQHGPSEIRDTQAEIRILLGDQVITRVDDTWSRSVRDHARLAAYPLAEWLAASWWRLRWEPARDRGPRLDPAWRMAHESTAAGGGFLWPRMCFESDGASVDIVCRPTPSDSAEPVRYLTAFRATLPASELELAIDGFVNMVIARLESLGHRDSSLHRLWQAVCEERRQEPLAEYRRREARMGYEPDEAPLDVMDALHALATRVGAGAVDEIAPLCAGPAPGKTLAAIEAFAATSGVPARVEIPDGLRPDRESHTAPLPPWDRGRSLAKRAREAWGIAQPAITGEVLADLLHVPQAMFHDQEIAARPLLGLAVRDASAPDRLSLLLRRRLTTGRRFEAARLLCDALTIARDERWLPATDAKTLRQKTQRAFAAELLMPIDALRDNLEHDFSDESVEYAAALFGVSPLAVRSHLANHGLIPSDFVGPSDCS